MLVIRLRGAGGGGGGGGVRTAVRLKSPRACHRHAAAAKRVGLNGDNPPDVVVADFSFEEEGTRVWQNTTVVSQVVNEAVTLEFLTKHRVIVSPGLPYKIKIKATRWDDKPAAGERVTVCRSPSSTMASEFISSDAICVNSNTDEKGIAKVMFNADDSPYYNLQASINSTHTRIQVRVVRGGRAALGALRAEQHGAALLPLYIDLRVVAPLTVHFVVITRGGIIYRWGATTQCPITSSTDKIITSPRNSICPNTNLYSIDKILNNNVMSNSTELDSLLDNYLSKVMLPIKVSPQMCPESHLLAYFYHNDELITASKHFEMEDCFVRKVEATWEPRLVTPGTLATLQLTTPGPALCALTVLNTASKWTHFENVRDLVMNGLRRLMDSHRNLTEHDAAGECFLTSDSPSLSSSRDLLSWWLAAAGVRLLDDHPRSCEAAPELMMDDVPPRTDFSESWLWKLSAVSSRGSVSVTARAPDAVSRYEATALCVSRAGLALSAPAVLQVFREVFIHASGPSRARRGEAIVIPYRVFNYLYTSHAVEIRISTNHVVEGSTHEVVCLPSRASVSRRLTLTCRETDSITIRVNAIRNANCSNDDRDFSDEILMKIEVDPEGVPVQEMKSALLCGLDSVNFTSSSDVSWNWTPVQAVPGTESLTVWTTTDLMGPLLAYADGLVNLPRGCGEQNMARLATALLALRLLEPHSPAADDARDQVARGFTRQLQFASVGGGFSAFGRNDPTPSTWLTAFTLRYIYQAYKVISGPGPLPPILELSHKWLLNQQIENGCFRNTGHVFHHLLKGGLDEGGEICNVALTAYVIISLTESSLPYKVLNNSLPCLRALAAIRNKTNSRIYAQALITYAFMKLRKYDELGNDTLMGNLEEDYLRELIELLRIAKRSGDFVWWETGNLATSIESTGYALLAMSECPPRRGCEAAAAGALRWLSAHRGSSGGFLSTQDTLVALEAMSRMPALPPGGRVTLQTAALTRSVTPGAVPELITMNVDTLRVGVEGPGCALVQATRSYNTLEPHEHQVGHSSLSVHTHVETEGPFDCSNDLCFCAAVLQVCAWWRGSLPAMSVLSVTMPTGYAPSATLLYAQLNNHTLLRRVELSSTTNKVSLYLGTRDGSDTDPDGHECYTLNVVGPRVKTKPAYAEIIDYYRPQFKDTQMYTIPEDCPPRRARDESSKYLPSDNLFTKAKSLDSEEVVISYEYTLEDLPEGIPLEDPIYDNLTRINKNIPKTIDANVDKIPSNYKAINKNNASNLIVNYKRKTEGDIKSNNASRNELRSEQSEKIHLNHVKTRNEETKVDVENDSHESEPKQSLNPLLSSFHIIDSENDLQVPSGVEGPVPAVVLPPPDFLARHMGSGWRENVPVPLNPQYLRENYYKMNYIYDIVTRK